MFCGNETPKIISDRCQSILENKKVDLQNICRLLGIKRLYAFGSAVSGKFRDNIESLTVEEYTNNYFELQYKLRDLFKREIDIVTEPSLSNPYFIESINKNKGLIYEA